MMARFGAVLAACPATIFVAAAQPTGLVPSKNDSAAKSAIADFAAHVLTQGWTAVDIEQNCKRVAPALTATRAAAG